MPFKAHYRITIHGTCFNEPCSMGVSAAPDTDLTDETPWNSFVSVLEVANQALSDSSTFVTTLKPICGVGTVWNGIRVNAWNNAGEMVQVAEKLFGSPITSVTSNANSGFISCVTTTLTDRPGRTARGRIYIPACGMVVQSDGQFSAANTTTVNTAVKTWLTALNNAPALDAVLPSFHCVVASKGSDEGQGAGKNTTITKVRTNSIPDVQRRRFNKQSPTKTDLQTVT